MHFTNLYIVSGKRHIGKSTFCRQFSLVAQKKQLDVAGLLSPPILKNDKKITILVENLRSGEQKSLAYLEAQENQGPQTEHWFFNADALQWGNTVLSQATPCDILIVDELGPLELLRHEGWLAGVKAIDEGDYRLGIVVVRPHLLHLAQARWQGARTIVLLPYIRGFQTWFWKRQLLTLVLKTFEIISLMS